jgi:RHS repeat-associated protein
MHRLLRFAAGAAVCALATLVPIQQSVAQVPGVPGTVFAHRYVLSRHVVGRFVAPIGGALTAQELPGSSNPSEPYSSVSGGGRSTPKNGFGGTDSLGLVNPVTGSLSLGFTDLSVPERGTPLDLSRTYNSVFAGVDGPFGHGWSFTFGMHLTFGNHRVTVNQENGSQVTFKLSHGTYSAPPRVIAWTHRKHDGSFEFLRGSTTSTCPTYSLASCVLYQFSAKGRLMNYTAVSTSQRSSGRPRQRVYSVAYSSGRPLSVSDPYQRKFRFTYSSHHGNGGLGRITQVTYPDGSVEKFAYSSGNLIRVTSPSGAVTHFSYDSTHQLTSETDSRGGVSSVTYNGPTYNQSTRKGYVLVGADGGNATSFSYSPGSTRVTDPSGHAYTVQYRESEVVELDQGSATPPVVAWHYAYDPNTLAPTSITDPNGGVTSAAYDDQGNVLAFTDPMGLTRNYRYKHNGSDHASTTETDAMGVTTTTVFDVFGNVDSQSTPIVGTGHAQTTTFAYGDPQNPTDMTSMTDANGAVWTYAYDKYGNLTSITDPLGDQSTFTYNILGLRTSETAPDGNVQGANPKPYTTTVTYTKDYNILSVADGLGAATTNAYDSTGNLVSQTDSLGNQTAYTYDANGQLTKLRLPTGNNQDFTYSPDGALASQTDPAGGKTSFSYDSLGRLISTSDPLGHSTSFSYDPAGNLVSTTDPSGIVTADSYDLDGQLISTTYGDGVTHGVTRAYDGDGRQISMTDGTGTTTTAYDSLGRVVGTTDGAGGTVGYAYDMNGNVTAIGYPNGQQVTRTLDQAGRVSGITDWLGNTTHFRFDASSNLTGETFPAGNVDAFQYDGNANVTGIQNTFGGKTIASFTYSRNTNTQITSTNQSGTGQTNQAYTYDQNGRLTSENGAAFSYDSRGNPTALATGAQLTYNAGDELTSMSTAAGGTKFTFDANGERTGAALPDGTSLTYGYDAAGNMTSFNGGSTSTTTYGYDGDGMLMSLLGGGSTGSTHRFVWDSVANAPRMIADGATSYIYGPDGLPLEQIDGSNNILYYHHDQLGSTRLLTDGSGAVVGTGNYDAYGNPAGQSGVQTPFGFAGQYEDANSGLIYMGGNFYDPTTGQYLRKKLPGKMKSGQLAIARSKDSHYKDLDPNLRVVRGGGFNIPQVDVTNSCGPASTVHVDPCGANPPVISGVSVGYTYAKRAAIMDSQRKIGFGSTTFKPDVIHSLVDPVSWSIHRAEWPAGGVSFAADTSTDKYGRVKVQFFWDRSGGRSEDPSWTYGNGNLGFIGTMSPYAFAGGDPINGSAAAIPVARYTARTLWPA